MTDQRQDGAEKQEAQEPDSTQRNLYILDESREPGNQVGFDPYNSVLTNAGEQGPP